MAYCIQAGDKTVHVVQTIDYLGSDNAVSARVKRRIVDNLEKAGAGGMACEGVILRPWIDTASAKNTWAMVAAIRWVVNGSHARREAVAEVDTTA